MTVPRAVRIGAHVSVAGGLEKAVAKAVRIGAESIQVFSSAPLRWQSAQFSEDEFRRFRSLVSQHTISPVFVHAPYLVNIASDNPVIHRRSSDALVTDLRFAAAIGAVGVIFHIGSHPLKWSGSKRTEMNQTIRTVLNTVSSEATLILENSAGSGTTIGSTLEELHLIADDLGDTGARFCIDTAHAHAAGYDLSTAAAVDRFVADLGSAVGLKRVAVFHLNDTNVKPGSHLDRHENIGAGRIGTEGMRAILEHPDLRDIPFILETPGHQRKGPDEQNIRTSRSLGNSPLDKA